MNEIAVRRLGIYFAVIEVYVSQSSDHGVSAHSSVTFGPSSCAAGGVNVENETNLEGGRRETTTGWGADDNRRARGGFIGRTYFTRKR